MIYCTSLIRIRKMDLVCLQEDCVQIPGRDPDSDPDAVLVHQILLDMNLEQKEEQYTQVFNAVY